jgi:hypothetical protein
VWRTWRKKASSATACKHASEVVEVRAEVRAVRPGERVMCSGAAAFAELAVADWGRATPVPADMSFEQAATLPVALQTMHNALVTAGRLAAGESVLIQGASSGVGLMALQIARHLGAANAVPFDRPAGGDPISEETRLLRACRIRDRRSAPRAMRASPRRRIPNFLRNHQETDPMKLPKAPLREVVTIDGVNVELEVGANPVENLGVLKAGELFHYLNIFDPKFQPSNYNKADGSPLRLFDSAPVKIDVSKRSKEDMGFWHRNVDYNEVIICVRGALRWEKAWGLQAPRFPARGSLPANRNPADDIISPGRRSQPYTQPQARMIPGRISEDHLCNQLCSQANAYSSPTPMPSWRPLCAKCCSSMARPSLPTSRPCSTPRNRPESWPRPGASTCSWPTFPSRHPARRRSWSPMRSGRASSARCRIRCRVWYAPYCRR